MHGSAPSVADPIASGEPVQRLVYTAGDKKVHAPKSYGDLQLPMDAQLRYLKPQSPDQTKTLSQLYGADSGAVHGYMEEGLGQQVTALSVKDGARERNELFTALIDSRAERDDRKAAREALGSALDRHDRMFVNYQGVKHWSRDTVTDLELVMLPNDYFPEKPDLPAKGTDLLTTKIKPNDPLSEKYWTYACVLIALVKNDGGFAKSKSLTNDQSINSLETAVQALHDHYKETGVEYDDTSTRRKVMTSWGYDLAFVGPVAFKDLRRHTELEMGKSYLFDITGHTVKIALKKKMSQTASDIVNFGEFFTAHSDGRNYNKDEFAQTVFYIWSK